MQAHLTQPIPLERLPADLPPHVRDLIGRMLVKDREQRLGSLAEAAAIIAGGPAAAPALGMGMGPAPIEPTAMVSGERRPGPPSDRSWIWALVAIVVVGIGVALTSALT